MFNDDEALRVRIAPLFLEPPGFGRIIVTLLPLLPLPN
jgi:hypothetical protein